MKAPIHNESASPGAPGDIVTAAIVFLAVNALAITVCAAGALSTSDYRAFPQMENIYRCLMGSELFFVMFVWPLLGAVSVPALAVLVVISVPLVVIAAWASNVPAYTVVLTQLLLLSVAAACISASKLIARMGPTLWRHYYLAAAALAGGVPLVQFLMLDLTGRGLRWLSCVSPFWAMELVQQTEAEVSRLYWAATVFFFAVLAVVAQRLCATKAG
jgi:hypothetical protein